MGGWGWPSCTGLEGQGSMPVSGRADSAALGLAGLPEVSTVAWSGSFVLDFIGTPLKNPRIFLLLLMSTPAGFLSSHNYPVFCLVDMTECVKDVIDK